MIRRGFCIYRYCIPEWNTSKSQNGILRKRVSLAKCADEVVPEKFYPVVFRVKLALEPSHLPFVVCRASSLFPNTRHAFDTDTSIGKRRGSVRAKNAPCLVGHPVLPEPGSSAITDKKES